MLLAEEFVLLCLRPNGRLARSGRHADFASGTKGALVAELLVGGHISVQDEAIHPTGTHPDDPLLAHTLDRTAALAGKRLTGARLLALEDAGWKEVTQRLVDASVIGQRRFAPIPARWPIIDAATHERVVTEVRAAAVGTLPLDDRMAVLLSLAGHCQALEVVAPERRDRATARKRMEEATEALPGLRPIALAAKFGTPTTF